MSSLQYETKNWKLDAARWLVKHLVFPITTTIVLFTISQEPSLNILERFLLVFIVATMFWLVADAMYKFKTFGNGNKLLSKILFLLIRAFSLAVGVVALFATFLWGEDVPMMEFTADGWGLFINLRKVSLVVGLYVLTAASAHLVAFLMKGRR